MTINFIFHAVKIILVCVFVSSGNPAYVVKFTVPNIVFMSWLLACLLITSVRLVYSTKHKFLSCYRSHKSQFFLMIWTLIFCLGAQIFKQFQISDPSLRIFKNPGWPRFLLGCFITLGPALIYLVTKKVEDCF